MLPRSAVYDPDVGGVFHCYSRCVRGAFLCGTDKKTGRDYNHRRVWIQRRLEWLAGIFAIEVLAFAIMANHFHSLLNALPQIAKEWTDEEVACRWLQLFHCKEQWDDTLNAPKAEAIRELVQDPKAIKKYRKRLASISWFMRCLKADIAVMANREDGISGCFWEKRFGCKHIADEHFL